MVSYVIISTGFYTDSHINGNLYHYAGNNPVKYLDPDGRKIVSHITNNEDEDNIVKKAINRIKSFPDGAELIKKIDDKKFLVKIVIVTDKSDNRTDADALGQKGGCGSTVYWNPENRNGGTDDKGLKDRDPIVGLMHELGHAESFYDGNYDITKSPATPGTTPSGEKNSLKRENQMRKFLNIALRTFYYPLIKQKTETGNDDQ